MNRSVLESDPHRVLEGMAIAGYAVGASQGYVCVRGEYPLVIQRLQTAIKQGGTIVMDQTTSMVDVARYFMEFCMDESCGKCVPCRVGTVQMHRLLERIVQGSAGPEELARLEALCGMARDTSPCGLGQTAPNPTLSTLRYFRHEYEEKLSPGTKAQRLGLPVRKG